MTPFYKFHGTGNDFIMIDGFTTNPVLTTLKIREVCNRRTGVGADGLIIIAPSTVYDFEMIYYNSDGSKASMCGNGARCAVAFAQMLGIATKEMTFLACDGEHSATVDKGEEGVWHVEVTMTDASFPDKKDDGYYINTGTHHFVKITDSVKNVDIMSEGPVIRNDKRFAPEGVNVNWISITPGHITIRTYEKGVEEETLSCGTGVTASALVAGSLTYDTVWNVETKGGTLEVTFVINDDFFSEIKLKGPAKLVFTGETIIF
jgi:diaminopimelate epimerase